MKHLKEKAKAILRELSSNHLTKGEAEEVLYITLVVVLDNILGSAAEAHRLAARLRCRYSDNPIREPREITQIIEELQHERR